MKLDLSILIVNYNGLKYLKNCIESIEAKTSKISYEIVIIDNNSQDNSCSFIESEYPKVRLIKSKINYGFGKGNNEAFKVAKGDYILLLNNDTILLDDLSPIVDFLISDKTVGVVGITMLDSNKRNLPAAGLFPNKKNMFQLKKLFYNDQYFSKKSFTDNSYDVDWVSGSFMMLSRGVYEKINGFDEDYFLYVEDVDFCKKIKDIGLKRIFLPHFKYIHFVGFNNNKNQLLIKGYKTFINKHFTGIDKLILLAILQVNSFVKRAKRIITN